MYAYKHTRTHTPTHTYTPTQMPADEETTWSEVPFSFISAYSAEVSRTISFAGAIIYLTIWARTLLGLSFAECRFRGADLFRFAPLVSVHNHDQNV